MTMASKRRVSLEWRNLRWLCGYRGDDGACGCYWGMCDGVPSGRCRIDVCPLILGDEQHKPIIKAGRSAK
ncbi:MAG TPA: hypothetical protein VM223_27975 [Planctomycetota bacterium]|nr:hypothetical protein [Planctomycetota bacterium]